MTAVLDSDPPRGGTIVNRLKLLPLVVVLLVAAAAACRTVTPDAGHEAVLVRKPLIFGSGGVDSTPVKTCGIAYDPWLGVPSMTSFPFIACHRVGWRPMNARATRPPRS